MAFIKFASVFSWIHKKNVPQISGGWRAEYKYDFKLHKVHEYKKIKSEEYRYIIIEGIMGFQNQRLNDISCLRVFVNTDMDIMLARRIQRDGKEWFFKIESTIHRYLKYVRNGYLNYILPSLKYADIVIDGNIPFEKKEITEILYKQGFH